MPVPQKTHDIEIGAARDGSAEDLGTTVHADPELAMPAKLTGAIRAAGMGDLAALILQIFKPLSWIGGQMVWLLQPFVEMPGTGKQARSSVSQLARMLERDDGVDQLVEQLRAPRQEGSA